MADARRQLLVLAGAPTGVLVPERDAKALAAAATALIEDDELRLRLGANAASDARQRFDFEAQVSAYLGWYHDLAVPSPPAPAASAAVPAAR